MSSIIEDSFQQRKVFYISGFDPRGARYYHRLYQDNLQLYAEKTDLQLDCSPRQTKQEVGSCWQIHNHSESIQTDYVFLDWRNVILDNWPKHPLKIIWQTLTCYLRHFWYGRWYCLKLFPIGSLITFFYPFIIMLTLLAGFIGMMFYSYHTLINPTPNWILLILFWVSIIAVSWFALYKVKSLWLLRFFNFNASIGGNYSPMLHQRIKVFADCIQESLQNPEIQEIQLIAHSNGSILLVPLLKELLARQKDHKMPDNFTAISLGQVIPLLTSCHANQAFFQDIKTLSQAKFQWYDFSFPPDGACCPTMNPFMPFFPDYQVDYHELSPQFFRYYNTKTYRHIRRNKFDLHFRYLMCGDKPSPWDIFTLTTRPQNQWGKEEGLCLKAH